ncbi:MAG: PocR ligand-binding domain-containing protein [Limnochordia bacterium]|jgi:two-component system response regulator YesN
MERQDGLFERAMETAVVYSIACGVNCKVVDRAGKSYGEEKHSLCSLVFGSNGEAKECRRSDLYGGYQAEQLGDYYVYFCPAGLANWAVPVLNKGVAEYYLIGGPVLLHEVDSLFVDGLYRRNPSLRTRDHEVREALRQIPVVSPTRVRYLAKLLMRLSKDLMQAELPTLSARREYHELGAGIAETIHEQKANGGKGAHAFELEKDLIFCVKTGDQLGARRILNEILGIIYFEDTSFKVKKSRIIALTALLSRAAIEAGADLDLIFGIENSYLDEIQGMTDLMELSWSLVPVLERFIESTFGSKSLKNRDLMYKAVSFIRTHYREDLVLEDAAREVGLHPTYFSKLFKEEMGISFTDYLSKVRVEAAKLLMRSDYSLAEISQMVGFNDQSYFTKVFKKHTGESPHRWRTQMLA